MSKVITVILAVSILILPMQLAAGQFDGSDPLLCAVIQIIECGAGGDCKRRGSGLN